VRVPGKLETLEGGLPDTFDATDQRLQRAAGVSSAVALLALAEQWRPWRAYAAQLLRVASMPDGESPRRP
jgi:3-methyladenine DNA glycosylase/8-oxoguanine DNA glycosylase